VHQSGLGEVVGFQVVPGHHVREPVDAVCIPATQLFSREAGGYRLGSVTPSRVSAVEPIDPAGVSHVALLRGDPCGPLNHALSTLDRPRMVRWASPRVSPLVTERSSQPSPEGPTCLEAQEAAPSCGRAPQDHPWSSERGWRACSEATRSQASSSRLPVGNAPFDPMGVTAPPGGPRSPRWTAVAAGRLPAVHGLASGSHHLAHSPFVQASSAFLAISRSCSSRPCP
jgi:hypothetical protein